MGRKNKTTLTLLFGASMMTVFGLAIFGNQGCTAKMPSATTFVATATPTVPPNVIANMEDGGTYLNPAMSGVGPTGVPNGFWVASSWGDPRNIVNGTSGADIVFLGGMGANGTNGSIHIYGTIYDWGDGQYPSYQLEGKLKGGQYFDALVYGFTGVKYYLKIGTTDTCTYRRFNVPCGGTTPPSGGGWCTSQCFSHFGAALGTASTGLWTQRTHPFLSLSRAFGNPLTPATLSGANLQQLLQVQWQFGLNLASPPPTPPRSAVVDYWVDEIEFF